MSEAIASKEERLVAYNANIAAADRIRRCLRNRQAAEQGQHHRWRWLPGVRHPDVRPGIVSAVLPMHYKTIEGADPDALVGIVNAFNAVASLVSNLMFGNFSDRSRSRFGRRTRGSLSVRCSVASPCSDRHHA
ncbi:MAG: hypothetical protein ACLT4Y_09685 [Bifidobacterium breve]